MRPGTPAQATLEPRLRPRRRRTADEVLEAADLLPLRSPERSEHPRPHALRRREVLLWQVSRTAAAHVAAAGGAQAVHQVVHGARPEEAREELLRSLVRVRVRVRVGVRVRVRVRVGVRVRGAAPQPAAAPPTRGPTPRLTSHAARARRRCRGTCTGRAPATGHAWRARAGLRVELNRCVRGAPSAGRHAAARWRRAGSRATPPAHS